MPTEHAYAKTPQPCRKVARWLKEADLEVNILILRLEKELDYQELNKFVDFIQWKMLF